MLADHAAFSNDIRPLVGKSQATGADAIGGLGSTDAPDHTKLRKILTPEFTMRRLRELEPRISQIVEEQLDVVELDGPGADLVESFAFPVPFRVICELLGLPQGDRERFRAIGHARFDATAGVGGLFGAMSESREFLIDAVARQRHDPGDGLIGSILERHGDDLTDVELGGLADGVFTGGFETSASMLALGAVTLLQHPERMRGSATTASRSTRHRRAAEISHRRPGRLPAHRTTRHDPARCRGLGATSCCAPSAAPTVTRSSGTTPTRSIRRGNGTHLAFGHGLHRCVGPSSAGWS